MIYEGDAPPADSTKKDPALAGSFSFTTFSYFGVVGRGVAAGGRFEVPGRGAVGDPAGGAGTPDLAL